MNALVILVPAALFLGLGALVAFLWSLKGDQYEDLEGAAWRVLVEDEEDKVPAADPAPGGR